MREVGRNALITATTRQRLAILSGKSNTWAETAGAQEAGARAGHVTQSSAAASREHIPRAPPLSLDHEKWACSGGVGEGSFCDFDCIANLTLNNMIGATEIEILRWV